jgi:LacI family transcriptional regulator
VITMDDHMVADHLQPPLTTIRMPMGQMGEFGARLLLDAIDGAPPAHVIADEAPLLIERGSTAPPTRP